MQTEDEQLILKKAKQAEYFKLYREKNKAKIKIQKEKYNKLYSEINKDKIKARKVISNKLWQEKNKEKNKEKRKIYNENNKEKIRESKKISGRKYYQNNKEKFNEYRRNRKQNQPLFKLRCNLSSRILKAFKSKSLFKSQYTIDMLGCDLKTAKAHLEKQFTKGMNWSNQGKWHVDHIIPCASAKNEEELIKLFHYTNLQPLWAFDNISKSDKIIEKQLFLL
jgi:hypothetical protein